MWTHRHAFLLALVFVLLGIAAKAAEAGETLSNGIVLPREWPPRLSDFPTSVEKDPIVPPYLNAPPAVIPIDVGRQLFVDDFLIAETTLKRTFHLPKYHLASPVLKPDKPWEMKNADHAAAMVFSDGVWYDPKDQLFKMWYLVGESAATGYATSRDGIHWDKPSLDVRPPTNIVQPGGRDSSTVWLDLEEKDSTRRFKMFRVIGAGEDPVTKWNNNVQSAGGGFLVVGDELYFYVSGRSGVPGSNKAGILTTGLATLRRDGFASMGADANGGTLTTRPVRFRGRHLFVNVDDPHGELRVEILNQAGQVMPRFTVEHCVPLTANKTLQPVRWNGVDDLSSLANQPVRFRFHLKNGQLYAFWVSPETSGASYGYVAAGGPGFSSNRDMRASSPDGG